jgi:hypothetical protein
MCFAKCKAPHIVRLRNYKTIFAFMIRRLKKDDVNMMIKTETTIYTCMLLAKTENGWYLNKLRSEHINLMCTSERK